MTAGDLRRWVRSRSGRLVLLALAPVLAVVSAAVAALAAGGADFTVSLSPASRTLTAGGSVAYQVTVTPSRGFTGRVDLAAAVSGSQVAATPTPAFLTVTGRSAVTGSVTVTAADTAADGARVVTVNGTGGGRSNAGSAALAVRAAPTFSVGVQPGTLSVAAGGNSLAAVAVTGVSGFTGPVGLTVTGLPAGAAATFAPAAVSLGAASPLRASVLTVTTAAGTPAGTSTLTVTGTSGTRVRTTTVVLRVTGGGARLSVSAAPSAVLARPGGSVTTALTIGRTNYAGPVTLAASGLPAGVTASFTPNGTTGNTSTLTLRATGSAADGSYPVTVTASGAGSTGSGSAVVTLVLETAGRPFLIAGTVGALAPGVIRPIDLSLTNTGTVALPVTGLAVRLPTATSKPDCSVTANYELKQYTGRYPLTVPAGATVTLSGLGVPQADWPALTMRNLPTNQDACKGASMSLTYSGTAEGGVVL